MKFKKESKSSEEQKDEDYQKFLKNILLNNSSKDLKLNPSLILEEIKINKENEDNGLNTKKCKENMCHLKRNIDHDYACLHYIPVIHQKFGFASSLSSYNIYGNRNDPCIPYAIIPRLVPVAYTPHFITKIQKEYLVQSSKNKDFWYGYFSTLERLSE
jgi:hypothetical protein